MALSTYDLAKGLDFTGLTEATAGDHNNLVDLSTPKSDTATEGKGLVLWTVDSAAGVPVVPNAVATTKWKRYFWLRIPFAGATVKNATIYAWNDDAPSVATYLKWLEANTVDTTALIAAITLAQETADFAYNNANSAIVSSATAVSTANSAYNKAVAAQATADGALAAAQAPLDQILPNTIPVDLLETVLNFAGYTITLPAESVTVTQLASILNLSGKTVTLPAATIAAIIAQGLFTGINTILPVAGATVVVPHGLGAVPAWVRVVLVCVTNDAATGYLTTDGEIDLIGVMSLSNESFLSVLADATNVSVTQNSNGVLALFKKPTGAWTQVTSQANFKFKVYARL